MKGAQLYIDFIYNINKYVFVQINVINDDRGLYKRNSVKFNIIYIKINFDDLSLV